MPNRLEAASDTALVLAVSGRDEAALQELHRRHAGPVLALARRVAGNDDLGAEVVQEVFVRLWSGPSRFDPDRGSLRAFLLADAHGRAVDLVRSEVARRRREERDLVESVTVDLETPEEEVVAAAASAELRAAIETLSGDERRAIELAYFGGHSYREVAELLGEPEGTVKSRIRTGLLRLRETLTAAAVAPL
jgi:RNA polymerase sigma-70 factor (ECF subfamily)